MNHENPSPSPSITFRHKAYSEHIRKQFTWHLRRPFVEGLKGKRRFDNTHWWDESPDDITPSAALYELARRHPDVGRALTNRDSDNKRNFQRSEVLKFLCKQGLSNWKTIAASVTEGVKQTQIWEFVAGKSKGLDFRDDKSLFRCVTEVAFIGKTFVDLLSKTPFTFI